MNYTIKYDGEGRLRVRCGKFAFTEKQGFGIAQFLKKYPYISEVITSHSNGGILITYQSNDRENVLLLLNEIRKTDLAEVEPVDDDVIRQIDREFQNRVASMIVCRGLCRWLLPSPIRTIRTIYKALSYLAEGISSLLKCEINVSVLDGAAIGACLAQGKYSSANSIMFLLSLSSLMEDYTRKRTRNALSQSLAIHVDQVWLVTNQGEVFVPMSQVHVGDAIRIRTGGMIPVDGTVVDGEAMINEASMTGEPLAVLKQVDSTVYAGTVVEEGSLVIQITALSSETRIQKIIEMIDRSENLKAEVQGKAERLADSIVPFSFLTAIGTYVFTRNITKALSVLMVDYSCAIKLSIPISVISAMREAAGHRIMIKGGKYLESFAAAETIVFDKTGTLTEACPKVKKIIPFGEFTRDEVLRMAACLEEHFPHSVANAIVKQAQEEGLLHEEEHAEVEYVVAHGIASYLGTQRTVIGSAHFIFEDEKIPIISKQITKIEKEINGCSAIYLAVGGELAGVIGIYDPVRNEAKAVIQELRELGISNIVMLTGDSENAAKAVAEELGITSYKSQVLPGDKAGMIEKLRAEGSHVIMVGDGINDSPALSAASVSVAMKDSSDIAKEVADITLLSANLDELITLRRLSQKLFQRIHQNYRFILIFNTTLLAMGLGGIISPQTSALYHNLSTLGISAMSMRPCLQKSRM